jgi:tetratricopeptide (TPR) repeat protein
LRGLAVFILLLFTSGPVHGQTDDDLTSLSHIVGSGKRVFMLGLLSEGEYLADNGYFYDACVTYNGILARGEEEEGYFRHAEFGIAENLLQLGLAYSAFTYFARIVDAGPGHPRYLEVVPQLVLIHRLLPGLQSVREYIAIYPAAVYPAEMKDEIAFTAALFHYNVEQFEEALPLLEGVTREHEELYLKARYLLGTTQVRLNRAREALEAFKEILRYVRDAGQVSDAARELESRAIMAMARIFYSTGDFVTALRYYKQIEKYSPHWLQALFEESWAYFRLGQFERAMGTIHTLTAPYFEGGYFPETAVVQAVIMYTNCRYDDAVSIVDRFVEQFDGLRKELKERLDGTPDPTDFYFWLLSLSTGRGQGFTPRLKRIFNLALSDQKLARAFALVLALDREKDWLETTAANAAQHTLALELLGEVVTYRELALGSAGEMARNRLDGRRRELQRYLTQGLRVKFESINVLREHLSGDRELVSPGKPPQFQLDGNDDYLPWPFWGGYWKDELEHYYFRVENLCPAEAP